MTSNVVLRNNIFVAPFKYMVNASADLISSNALTFDHNAYFTSGVDVTTTYTDVPFKGDATSLYNVDPMLVAPPTNLQLGAGSKAIGAGMLIGNIPTNAMGACWAKPPNMGAY